MTVVMAEAPERANAESKEAVFAALAARFGERLSRSEALRAQHANTLTWLKVQPPDAVVFPLTEAEISETVALCAAARVPIIPFGAGTSLEGHLNAPFGGLSLDLSRMKRVISVHEGAWTVLSNPG